MSEMHCPKPAHVSEFNSAKKYGRGLKDFWEQHAGRRKIFLIQAILRSFLRIYNRAEYNLDTLPENGPFFVITAPHKSNFDTAALSASDPYSPGTQFLEKSEWFDTPKKAWLMNQIGGIPVKRDGTDTKAVRKCVDVLKKGGIICYAPEATRSLDGRLKPPVNTAIALILLVHRACPKVPFYTIVEHGTYQVQRKGQKIPRPHKIRVISGPAIDIDKYIEEGMDSKQQIDAVAKVIRESFVTMLPPEEQSTYPRLTRTMEEALREEALPKKPKQSLSQIAGNIFRGK